MRSLDDLLTLQNPELQAKFSDLFRAAIWSRGDRDGRLDTSRDLIVEMADRSVDFVQNLVQQQVEGKSLLFWQVVRESLSAECSFLEAVRSSLDAMSPEERAASAFDYDWLNARLQERNAEYADLTLMLEHAVESGVPAEDL